MHWPWANKTSWTISADNPDLLLWQVIIALFSSKIFYLLARFLYFIVNTFVHCSLSLYSWVTPCVLSETTCRKKASSEHARSALAAQNPIILQISLSTVGQSRYFALRTAPLSCQRFFHSFIFSRHFRLIMFASHRPRVFRSRLGCCICGAKSSSSRFTSSSKYELLFSGCFQLNEKRQGEICNACVLLVKRWKKLPSGSSKNWKHVRILVESFCCCVFIQDLRCARAVSFLRYVNVWLDFFFLTGRRQQSNCKKNY